MAITIIFQVILWIWFLGCTITYKIGKKILVGGVGIKSAEFFMLCLVVIAGTVILGACVTMGIYLYKKRKKKLQGNMMPKPQNIIYQ